MAKKSKIFSLKLLPLDIARFICGALIPILRLKRVRPDGTPYKEKLRGGAVIAANHTKFSDPFVVGTTFWYRRSFFFVAEAVMRNRFLAWLLRGAGAIKVEREKVDIEAIKKSVKVLKEGRLLIIFPQGAITQTENVESIKSGAALMALQAGVPILPMHICKKPHWYSRTRVVIGEKIDPAALCQKKMPSVADIQNITDALMNEMRRCDPALADAAEKEQV